MIQCAAEARAAIDALARALDCDERVIATDVLAPAVSPEDRWTCELTLEPRAGGCPPALQREAAARDVTIRDVSPQGLYWRVVATA